MANYDRLSNYKALKKSLLEVSFCLRLQYLLEKWRQNVKNGKRVKGIKKGFPDCSTIQKTDGIQIISTNTGNVLLKVLCYY